MAGINWASVCRYARLGGEREDITVALGFTPEQLGNAEVLERLQQEMARGAALHRLDLLGDVKRIRDRGSVNAVLASLKQKNKWNRHDAGKEKPKPDTEAAVAEMERILRRSRAPR